MKDHLTIHLSIDWRVLVILAAALAVIIVLKPDTSAKGSAALPAGSNSTASSHTMPAAPARAVAAVSGAGGRRFYVTSTTKTGNQPLTACTSGFHMASLWEILDVSNLTYAGELPMAATRDDSGSGPPSGIVGWVRTGYDSSSSSTVGTGNCNNWSTPSSTASGTTAKLSNNWGSPPEPAALWRLVSTSCDTIVRVWCVED